MRDYIIRRLLLLVPILPGVSLLTFATFRIIPGDAAVRRGHEVQPVDVGVHPVAQHDRQP